MIQAHAYIRCGMQGPRMQQGEGMASARPPGLPVPGSLGSGWTGRSRCPCCRQARGGQVGQTDGQGSNQTADCDTAAAKQTIRSRTPALELAQAPAPPRPQPASLNPPSQPHPPTTRPHLQWTSKVALEDRPRYPSSPAGVNMRRRLSLKMGLVKVSVCTT